MIPGLQRTASFASAQEAGEFMDHVPLTGELRQAVAFGNAARYFGLPQD